jgi:hypothetical protein
LYWRDSHSTYVDFLLDLIKFAFGPKWHKQQVEAAEAQRHLVMRWGMSWYRHCKKVQAEQDTGEKTIFRTEPTGDAQSLLTLADDLYRMQLARSLTSELMRRLRSPEGFQGARYEIQVASVFLRSGFEIEWVSEKVKKHVAPAFRAGSRRRGEESKASWGVGAKETVSARSSLGP